MIGEECPRPGTATFHFTPSLADHLSVYLPALTMPWPEGPRQRVQYLDASPSTSIIVAAASATAWSDGTATAAARRGRLSASAVTGGDSFIRPFCPMPAAESTSVG